MDKKPSLNIPRVFGMLLFLFGILAGLLLATVITWANFEAVFYGFDRLSNEQLGTLRCPLLMTTNDTRTVSAEFSNPGDKPAQFIARTDISTVGPLQRTDELLSFAPGERKKLTWTVNADNLDLEYFIFVKTYQYPSSAGGTREATCGIFVLPLSFVSGDTVFVVTFAASLLGILGGLFLWERSASRLSKREIDTHHAMTALAIVLLAGMLLSFQGNWLGGIIALAVSILLMGAILFFTQGQ
jgi:hypothetical protein